MATLACTFKVHMGSCVLLRGCVRRATHTAQTLCADKGNDSACVRLCTFREACASVCLRAHALLHSCNCAFVIKRENAF